MEYCRGSDVEEFVRSQNVLSIETIRVMLFQMFYSLYSCREKLSLRHYDIKLLNFFVTLGTALLPENQKLIYE